MSTSGCFGIQRFHNQRTFPTGYGKVFYFVARAAHTARKLSHEAHEFNSRTRTEEPGWACFTVWSVASLWPHANGRHRGCSAAAAAASPM